jgi:membrane-associated protein
VGSPTAAPPCAVIIIVARFIPGGRTATTFSAGALEMPWRRFLTIDAVAAVLWATYIALLGYFGGEAFEQSLWKPILAAGLVAAAVTVGAELLRRARLS